MIRSSTVASFAVLILACCGQARAERIDCPQNVPFQEAPVYQLPPGWSVKALSAYVTGNSTTTTMTSGRPSSRLECTYEWKKSGEWWQGFSIQRSVPGKACVKRGSGQVLWFDCR